MVGPSFTINEWCKHRRVSRAEYYRMRARGDAPRTYGEGRMQRISPDADAEWLRKQEAESVARETAA